VQALVHRGERATVIRRDVDAILGAAGEPALSASTS
jgi:hypothetical protein